LMPTIPQRKFQFERLFKNVKTQIDYCYVAHPTLGTCQIIYDNGASFRQGGLSIGNKRQSLLDQAKGLYICFLDDDEAVSPDYVETLLRLVYLDKDVCVFRSLAKLSNNWALVDMSLKNNNKQINPDSITKRTPWHICPVRIGFAQQYKFSDSNYGEDFGWFSMVLKHCRSEAHTDRIIHQYNHGAHSEADKIK